MQTFCNQTQGNGIMSTKPTHHAINLVPLVKATKQISQSKQNNQLHPQLLTYYIVLERHNCDYCNLNTSNPHRAIALLCKNSWYTLDTKIDGKQNRIRWACMVQVEFSDTLILMTLD